MGSFVENVNKMASLTPANVEDLNLIVQNIDAINQVAPLANDLNDIIDNIIPNLAEILQADNNATIATEQALLATTNGSAQVALATTQAVIATEQATLATNLYDAFNDVYLGSKASAPTLDNDGNALLTGALYYDSTLLKMKVYDGSAWEDAGASAVQGIQASQVYTATAGQTVFNIDYDVGYVNIYVNGLKLAPSDFTATNGTSITLAVGATLGDTVECLAFGTFELANVYTKAEVDSAVVHKTGDETIAGVKTFTSSPIVPTPTLADNSTKVATTAFVLANAPVTPDATETTKGKVELATNAEVQAGTDTTRAVTPAGIKSAVIGLGQTWQNVTASRVLGTTYTNTTGRPIAVSITGNNSSTSEYVLYIGGIAMSATNDVGGSGKKQIAFGIVPNGATYVLTASAGALYTGSIWSELR